MPYCTLCDKHSPCRHWPTEDTPTVEPRPHDAGLDEQIDNAIRGKLTGETMTLVIDSEASQRLLGVLVVDGTEYPAPDTVVLNGYIYRRDDSAGSIL